ncbi:Lectin-domain containing receptor kinase [Quillaja saponaria]|uniref:Lectin-domain containing receptor kinase n=1 Tax=Quillaja saponaria TaxID=32244 RepID=A0AAD7L9K5_QUISA|nr:Lectin-domain containing receptor kinase [Quillaja saponaria]
MQDPRIPMSEPRKRKTPAQKASLFQLQAYNGKGIQEFQGPLPLKNGQKPFKRNLKNEVSFHKPERSNSDSLPDLSGSGNDYRALRRKYLLLEEESFALGRELRDVEDEVKTLEDEKFKLLDQLVVLEGLVDPSVLQSQGLQFPKA